MYQSKPKYLRLHGKKWHLKIRLTKQQQAFDQFKGKTHLVKSLGTDSLSEALRKRDQYLGWLYDQTFNQTSVYPSYGLPSALQEVDHGIQSLKQTTLQPADTVSVFSLEDALNKTLELKQNTIKETELKKYRYTYQLFIKHHKNKPLLLDSIRRQQVSAFIHYLRQEQKLTDKTILGHLNRLSVMFKTALAYEMTSVKNAFQGHQISSKPTVKRNLYYPEQIKKIYHALPEEYRLAWKICYFTGLRASELFDLDRNSIVDMESVKGTVMCFSIAINGGKTENAKRLVPIHVALNNELKDFDGFSISQLSFKAKRRKTVVDLFGTDFANTHDTHSLRHTFITTLVNELGSSELVEWLVGHSRSHRRSAIYKNYFHGFGLDKLNNAVQLMPDIFKEPKS